jgi:hypothetical protein
LTSGVVVTGFTVTGFAVSAFLTTGFASRVVFCTAEISSGFSTFGVFVTPPNSNTISLAIGGLERFGCSKYTTIPDNTTP